MLVPCIKVTLGHLPLARTQTYDVNVRHVFETPVPLKFENV